MQPAPYNPFQDPTGVVLIVLGIVFLVGGLFLCWPVAILGVVLLLIGLVMPTMQQQPAYYAPYPAYQPAYPQPQYPAQPMAPPAPGAPPAMPVPAQPATPRCPRCGQFLEYVPQYQRWYCRAENVYPWG